MRPDNAKELTVRQIAEETILRLLTIGRSPRARARVGTTLISITPMGIATSGSAAVFAIGFRPCGMHEKGGSTARRYDAKHSPGAPWPLPGFWFWFGVGLWEPGWLV